MSRSALSSCVFVLTMAAINALVSSLFGAEIAGGTAPVNTLRAPERVAEPQYAPASDEPLKAMKRFQLPAGFTSALWASEPLLGNPVAFCFDEQGRAFVAETFRYRTSVLDIRHYMFMLEDDLAARTTDDRIASTKKNFPSDWQKLEIETEIVRLVEDRNGDGRAETSSVYAGGMKTLLDGINSGVLAYNGALWCTNIPNLWRFSGLTKDGKAEKRESLSFGYGVRYSFTGHDMHGLALGHDGRLYFSFGDRGAHVKTREGNTLPFPDEGAVFRCEPDGRNLEVVYRGLRNPQELAFDNHGNLFTGDNDCDQGDRERWVYIVEGGDAGWRVGWQHPPLGKDHNMWLTEHMWEPRDAAKKNRPAYILSPILNIPDGPSGVAHNPGTGLPPEYDNAFLVCGFKGSSARSAISWWKVKEQGAGFAVDQSPAVFVGNVQATDVEFGPDSKIYFTEWGEGWEGTGRGRIFRLESAEVQQAQEKQIADVGGLIGGELLKKSTADLAVLLAHSDQRVRLRAQWALAAQKVGGIDPLLRAATDGVEGSQRALSRLHGIWGLAQIVRAYSPPFDDAFFKVRGREIGKTLAVLAQDRDSEVRAQAAWAMGEIATGELEQPLRALLADPEPRVKFFAGLALAKYARKWVISPGGAKIPAVGLARTIAAAAVRLAAENADRDEFLRHAAVMMLTSTADGPAITAAAANSSRSVRLAALLAMRRLGKSEITQFLNDTEPDLVLEAARAINDEGMADAWMELAKLIAKPIPEERLMLRVINANLRAGTPENAQALANYAADHGQPDFLRAEALHLLGTWPRPFQRDRVAGVFRPMPERGAAPAVAALQNALPKLLGAKSSAVMIAALEAAAALRAKDAGAEAFALVSRKDADGKVRAAALRTLAAIEDSRAAEAVRLAVADRDEALRVAGHALLGKLNPNEAVGQLAKAFPTAGVTEKKAIIAALGEIRGAPADKVLAGLFAERKSGKIPNEALLELLEAAEKRPDAELKAQLGAYQNSLPPAEPLARYAYALAGGDKENGERLFKEHAVAQCARCHKVEASGGEAGPDLTGIAAKKDRRYLLESIVLPNAQIAEGFQTLMITLKNNDIKVGIVKEETAEEVTLQMPIPGALAETVKKSEIKLRENAPSGMPPAMGEMLTKRELRDLLEYVASLTKP